MIVKLGSITSAARFIGISQPTLSTQLKSFEKELGFSLFEKEGIRLVPSPKGRELDNYCEEIFSKCAEMEEAITGKSVIEHLCKHELKIAPQYYNEVMNGSKTFEIRKNDRDFQQGDVFKLREFKKGHSNVSDYTGNDPIFGKITYITDYEQKKDMVVFSFEVVE
jgi:hypothetical protein